MNKKFVKCALMAFVLSTALGCSNQAVDETSKPIEMVTVDTESGNLLGYHDNGVYAFKGIPYATAKRFQSPSPIKEYENEPQNALTYGTVSPQDRGLNGTGKVNDFEFMTPSNGTADMVANENCQNLNVWSNDLESKKPVIVFFHGGGLSNGASSELSSYEGAAFAEKYDSVFVSVNHRLNVLGYLDLSEYGEEYKNSGNVGIEDCVVALQWVQDNIEKFGGDPNNVTILGQSGGGMKVTTLACMPETVDLFDKVFVMSGLYSTNTKEDSLENTQLLIDYLDVPEEKVLDTLLSMSYEDLLNASIEAGCQWSTATGNGSFETSLFDEETGKMNPYAAKRKWIWGTTFSEFSSNAVELMETGDPSLAINASNDEEIQEIVAEYYPVKTEEVINEFKNAYPNKKLSELLTLSNTPYIICRGTVIDQENGILKKFVDNNVEVYTYVSAYTLPFFNGVSMYHTGDMAFWFDNLDHVGYLVEGDREQAQHITDEMASALAAFIKTGNPSTDELTWNPYTEKGHYTMVFDTESECKNDFDTKLYELINENNEVYANE